MLVFYEHCSYCSCFSLFMFICMLILKRRVLIGFEHSWLVWLCIWRNVFLWRPDLDIQNIKMMVCTGYPGYLCLSYHSFTQWKLKLTQTNKLVLRRILSKWVEWGIGVRRASVERGTNKQTADFHLSYSTVARDEVKHIFYYQISALKNKTCQHHEGVMLSCKKFLDFA